MKRLALGMLQLFGGRLARRYTLLIAAVVTTLLAAVALLTMRYNYAESLDHLRTLQAEQARSAAARISQYLESIERELGWPALGAMHVRSEALELRRIEYLKLLRQVPAITEAAWIDAQGFEQLRVSRLHMDAMGQGVDRRAEPAWTEPQAGRVWRSPVLFRKQTEPYMTVAQRAGIGLAAGVIVVEVNLKFVWDVVAQIHPGDGGIAYVVDGSGALIAHPDISLVLRQTSMASLPQVAAALHGRTSDAAEQREALAGAAQAAPAHEATTPPAPALDARDATGRAVLSSWAPLPLQGWRVFVETPRVQALEPVWASLQQLAAVLALGLVLATAASAYLARRLVQPIRALQESAKRVASGDLEHRIRPDASADELAELADDFNRMATQLQGSYADLERRVDERTAELAKALAHQTAAGEVLQAIGRSVADTRPVYDAIVAACLKQFDYAGIAISVIGENGWLHLATFGGTYANDAAYAQAWPIRYDTSGTRLAIDCKDVLDFPDLERNPSTPDVVKRLGGPAGHKSVTFVPLMWQDEGVGALIIGRNDRGLVPADKLKLLHTFADQAVIAIQNARLFRETQEALAHRAAATEVLQVIASSVSDAQPVYEAILKACDRLFESFHMGINLVGEDGLVRLVAQRGEVDDRTGFEAVFPYRLDRASSTGTAVLEQRVMHYADVLNDPDVPPTMRRSCEMTGSRAVLMVPLVWEGRGIGVIFIARRTAGYFSDKEVSLIRTFADQAVIAIQNAHLFRETQEALAHQTATAQVLQVIGRSVADEQPVFETILDSVSRLFGSSETAMFRAPGDGMLHLAAALGDSADRLSAGYPRPLAETSGALAIEQRRQVYFADVLDPKADIPPSLRSAGALLGNFAVVLTPLLRRDEGVGLLAVRRAPGARFSDKELALLRTFADQAVIAIENARLLRDTQEALAQQTATAEVLQVISRSVADAEPVFAAILVRCEHLIPGTSTLLDLVDGDQVQIAAYRARSMPGDSPQARHEREMGVRAGYPHAFAGSATEAAIRSHQVVEYRDVARNPDAPPRAREFALRLKLTYSLMMAPLVWEGEPVGSIGVVRHRDDGFLDKEKALLQTFADQAVIAIQNARMVRELEEKSAQLEVASRHKSEFLANMSHELRTPLNAIIGFSEVLTEQMFGELNAKQMEYLQDIHGSGQHLLTLINDVLDLSKIEAGRMELELVEVDLADLLEHSLTLVRERATRQGLTLTLVLPDELPVWVADARKVKQVLLNLLSNAVKFTPAGGQVTLDARLQDDGRLAIAVADTGVGIAPQDQTAVFEAFRQASGHYLRKSEGTGLGLALAQRFVALHGGELRLHSEPGRGSTFTFTLPALTLRAA
ncbi:MAG: hypothetical protein RIQ60_47 [Pseudomonadota bacterium]|jgi:signal transduction histidine kinase